MTDIKLDIFYKLSVLLATGFGIGFLIPFGRGTLAAFAALFLVSSFLSLTFWGQVVVVALGIGIGVFVSHFAEEYFGVNDDGRIVIDEIVSIFITFVGLGAGLSWYVLGMGFLLNRLLDVWKPFPVNRFQDFPGGWGIMLDDVASGVASNIILRALLFSVSLL